MKISKPILIFLIIACLMLVYLLFFAGKKKPPQLAVQMPSGVPAGQNTPAINLVPETLRKEEPLKPAINQLCLTWGRDPFLLPKGQESKQGRVAKTPLKVVAIFEGSQGKMAILDTEIVRKGDMIGSEKVAEIGKDTVVLVRDNNKRVLVLAEPSHTEPAKSSTAVENKKSTDKVAK